MRSRRLYIFLTLSACVWAGPAIPTSVFGKEVADTPLADPVIEEPLRALLPENSQTVTNDPSACGLVGAATIPIALVLLQMLGLTGTKRSKGVPTQMHLTDDELK